MEYISTLAVLVVAFSLLYAVALWRRDNSIVDIFWGLAFILVALYTFNAYGSSIDYQFLATLLVSLWGLRLSGRILIRNWGRAEDWRYARWRKEWQEKNIFYVRSYAQIYLLQAIICLLVSLPIIFINTTLAITNEALVILGIIIWTFGFVFEATADYQLDQHLKENKQKNTTFKGGLWRHSRHPNYFGEATVWWGIWVLAMGVSLDAWWTVIGPLAITIFLLKVSGVPLLENKMKDKPGYAQYMKETNKFIPGPVHHKR